MCYDNHNGNGDVALCCCCMHQVYAYFIRILAFSFLLKSCQDELKNDLEP